MTHEEIARLAIETGVADPDLSDEFNAVTDYANATESLALFAKRIAEIERESCAELCFGLFSGRRDPALQLDNKTIRYVGNAIRRKGEQ